MSGLLKDIHGQPSTVRVVCLVCVLTACASVILPLFGYGETPDTLALASLLGAGVGAKVVQRHTEERGRHSGVV